MKPEITHNNKQNGIELKYPSTELPSELKQSLINAKFRWNEHKGIWYIPDNNYNRFVASKFGDLPAEG